MIASFRTIWITLALAGIIFILAQSYIALPRPILDFLIDSFLPILVITTFITILIYRNNQFLLLTGLLFAILTLITYLTTIFAKEYGTFFFLFAVYLLVDWYNFQSFSKNLTSELRNDRSMIAIGIVASTFIFGLITEIINLPFMIWSYNIPIPSMSSFGIPALIAAFGWTPWTLSILAIFYHFLLRSSANQSKPLNK